MVAGSAEREGRIVPCPYQIDRINDVGGLLDFDRECVVAHWVPRLITEDFKGNCERVHKVRGLKKDR